MIVETLGNDPEVIAAARGLVAAEQNFNPSAVSIPSICNDASLPATEELRGVVPLVDPAVGGSDLENENSATSLDTPFDAAGLSVAEVMAANGFSNFTAVDADGNAAAAPAAAKGAADAEKEASDKDVGAAVESESAAAATTASAALEACQAAATTFLTKTKAGLYTSSVR